MKFNQLRILTDENISPRVVSFLRQQGLDVVDVKENGWEGKEDKFLLEQAYLDKRFILTHDSDFGTLAIYQAQKYYGIIYLRLKNVQFNNIIRICEKLLQLEQELSIGCLIVVKESRIRIRQ
jgi:predicted nuclease of predicted toxin-antitoxin system